MFNQLLSFQNFFVPRVPARTAAARSHAATEVQPLGRLLSAVLLLIALAVSASYLVSATRYTSGRYELEALRTELRGLQEEQRALSVQVSERTAAASLSSSPQGYVPAGSPRYLSRPLLTSAR